MLGRDPIGGWVARGGGGSVGDEGDKEECTLYFATHYTLIIDIYNWNEMLPVFKGEM